MVSGRSIWVSVFVAFNWVTYRICIYMNEKSLGTADSIDIAAGTNAGRASMQKTRKDKCRVYLL